MECIWKLGTECDGTISNELMFKNQIRIPVCKKHLEEHKIIVAYFMPAMIYKKLQIK